MNKRGRTRTALGLVKSPGEKNESIRITDWKVVAENTAVGFEEYWGRRRSEPVKPKCDVVATRLGGVIFGQLTKPVAPGLQSLAVGQRRRQESKPLQTVAEKKHNNTHRGWMRTALWQSVGDGFKWRRWQLRAVLIRSKPQNKSKKGGEIMSAFKTNLEHCRIAGLGWTFRKKNSEVWIPTQKWSMIAHRLKYAVHGCGDVRK